MVTFGVLLDEDWLRLVTGGGRGRPVVDVWPAAGAGAPDGGWADALAVVTGPMDAAQAAVLVGKLARWGAVGVVSVAPAARVLVQEAERVGVAVAEADVPPGVLLPRLARVVAHGRVAEEGRAGRAAAEEAKELRRLLELVTGGQEDTAEVARWVGRAVEGRAYVVPPGGEVPVVPGGPVLSAERIAAVAAGVRDADAETSGGAAGWAVRLVGVGPVSPREVLVVVRPGHWPAVGTVLMGRAVEVLALWRARREDRERLRDAVREGVLAMLLDGQVEAARRGSRRARLGFGVLRAETVRVCTVSAPAGRRTGLVGELRERLGADGLVGLASAGDDRDHVVVVHPDADKVVEVLSAVVGREPGLYGGAGRPVRLEAAGAGHREAVAALPEAVDAPERWAEFSPVRELATALPEAEAHRWAADLFAPLAGWDAGRRSLCLETAGLALAYGQAGAMLRARREPDSQARGVVKGTARDRVHALAQAVGLDVGLPGDRVVLDLAVRVWGLRLKVPAYRGGPLALGGLLGSEQVEQWAGERLRRFGDDLLEVLTAWVECGLNTDRTAEVLRMSPKVIRNRLYQAEALGQRALISSPGEGFRLGVTDLVVALHVTGWVRGTVLTGGHLER